MHACLNRFVVALLWILFIHVGCDDALAKTEGKAPVTVKKIVSEYGQDCRKALSLYFLQAKVKYPPERLTLVCLKDEKVLYLFAPDTRGETRKLLKYDIMGVSGCAGPKLKQGDLQIPEGFYRLVGFKPDSIAHLALRVNYPNEDDREHARKDGRSNLGGDIMIHGSCFSTGCLAMGDDAIEELFILAHDTGLENIDLIFVPCDLTAKNPDIDLAKQPDWLPGLYEQLKQELKKYPI